MSKITPFLWFDNNLEEAIEFYSSIFPDAKVIEQSRLPQADVPNGDRLLTATFELAGQRFMAINGGPDLQFGSGAISFLVECESQQEIDHYWDRLVDGGNPIQCGWLTDKFGLTWQVTPRVLGEYLNDSDPEKAKRVMDAMLQMVKMDIDTLQKAYEQ